MIPSNTARYDWVDSAKGLAMFLVFYGHIVESVYNAGITEAFSQFKFLYSFHVPLFFFMAGFFGKTTSSYSVQFEKLVLRRLVPVFTFGMITLPFWPTYFWFLEGSLPLKHITLRCLDYLHGTPRICWTTWFLVCLFTTEVFAMFALNKLRKSSAIFVFGLCSLAIGLTICLNQTFFERALGFGQNTWFIYESFVALGFYMTGKALFPKITQLMKSQKWAIYPIGVLATIILYFSYDLNSPSDNFVVMLNASNHGQSWLFATSAFAGILSTLSLSMMIPSSFFLKLIGKYTLPLLGLNGLFLHFLNSLIVDAISPNNSHISITIYCIVVTTLSFAVTIPLAILMDKFVPQLIGKSNQAGPLLPSLHQTLKKLNKLRF